MLIKNVSELTSKGNMRGRKVILKIVEETLEKVNYFTILKELVRLEKTDSRSETLSSIWINLGIFI